MADRSLLPKHYLEPFKDWLSAHGHEYRLTTADFQVLQVRLKGDPRWHGVFYKLTRNPHYTVPQPLVKVTTQFIFDHKYANHHPTPGQSASCQGPERAEEAGCHPEEGDDSAPF